MARTLGIGETVSTFQGRKTVNLIFFSEVIEVVDIQVTYIINLLINVNFFSSTFGDRNAAYFLIQSVGFPYPM